MQVPCSFHSAIVLSFEESHEVRNNEEFPEVNTATPSTFLSIMPGVLKYQLSLERKEQNHLFAIICEKNITCFNWIIFIVFFCVIWSLIKTAKWFSCSCLFHKSLQNSLYQIFHMAAILICLVCTHELSSKDQRLDTSLLWSAHSRRI